MTVTENPSTTGPELKDGRVVAIAGPVVDVEFPRGSLPEINTALEFTVKVEGEDIKVVVAEVAQQIGDSRVRIVCMKPTDGLTRGTLVRNSGRGISVPVGDATLGHVFNVIGEPLDTAEIGGLGERWDIHREAPAFEDLTPEGRDVPHGHQGHRPAHAVPPRRQDRPVRRRRRRQDGADPGDDQPRRHPARWCVGVRRCRRAHP